MSLFGNLPNKGGSGSTVTSSATNGNITVNGSQIKVYDDTSINTSLADRVSDLLSRAINVKFPAGTTLTAVKGDGSNETSTIQAIIDYAASHQLNVFFPSGTYYADYLVPHTNSGWFGAGEKNTFLYATVSNQTSFIVMKDTNPIQDFFLRDMAIGGQGNANSNQDGLHFNAIAQTSSPYTGGVWYSRFENLSISNFSGNQIYLGCQDGSGDMANQFLFFRNVRAFRMDSTTSRSLKISGQFGQIKFEGCEFDGKNQTTIGAINVEIRSLTTTNDQVYTVHFDTCTFQTTDQAIYCYYAMGVLFTAPYFESCNSGLQADSSSSIVLEMPRFANVANGGNGWCIWANSSSHIVARDIYSNGSIDTVVKNTNAYLDYTVLGGSTKSTGYTVQYGVGTGTISIGYSKVILVNASTTHLTTLTDSHPTGTIITLIAWGSGSSVLIDKTGNLQFQDGYTLLTVPNKGTATFMKSDLGINGWVLISTTGTFS